MRIIPQKREPHKTRGKVYSFYSLFELFECGVLYMNAFIFFKGGKGGERGYFRFLFSDSQFLEEKEKRGHGDDNRQQKQGKREMLILHISL